MGPRPAHHTRVTELTPLPNPAQSDRAYNFWLAHLLNKRRSQNLNPHETAVLYRLVTWKRAQQAQAQSNPLLGIAIGAKQRQAKATGKAALYRNKYLNCRGRREKKGKPFYPDDPSQKHCKSQYNKWNKFRGKAGTRASKLVGKLDRKGKLTTEASRLLQVDIAKAERDALADLHTVSAVRTTGPSAAQMEMEALEGGLPETDFTAEGYPVETAQTSPLIYVGIGVGVLAVLGAGWMILR